MEGSGKTMTRLSDILSLALNPSILTGFFFCALAAKYESPGAERTVHAFLSVIFASLIPVGLILLLKARGKLSDIEMSIRSERDRVYLYCASGYAVGAAILLFSGASWPLWGFMALHVPNTLVLLGVNRWLKVSIHTMILTGLYAGNLMFFGAQTVWLGSIVLVAAWARWDAGNHTLSELICGAVIGGLLTSGEIHLLKAALGG